jgi:hypothetical protein
MIHSNACSIEFFSVNMALGAMGVTNEEKSELYKLLAALLHLGNLRFSSTQNAQGAEAVAMEVSHFRHAAIIIIIIMIILLLLLLLFIFSSSDLGLRMCFSDCGNLAGGPRGDAWHRAGQTRGLMLNRLAPERVDE